MSFGQNARTIADGDVIADFDRETIIEPASIVDNGMIADFDILTLRDFEMGQDGTLISNFEIHDMPVPEQADRAEYDARDNVIVEINQQCS